MANVLNPLDQDLSQYSVLAAVPGMNYLLQSNTGMPYGPENCHHKTLTSDTSRELTVHTTA